MDQIELRALDGEFVLRDLVLGAEVRVRHIVFFLFCFTIRIHSPSHPWKRIHCYPYTRIQIPGSFSLYHRYFIPYKEYVHFLGIVLCLLDFVTAPFTLYLRSSICSYILQGDWSASARFTFPSRGRLNWWDLRRAALQGEYLWRWGMTAKYFYLNYSSSFLYLRIPYRDQVYLMWSLYIDPCMHRISN